MSYTTVINIWPEEKIEYSREFKNSWGSAPVVWEVIFDRYQKLCCTKIHFHWMQGIGEMWGLWENPDVPRHHRSVFMMTFDKAFIAKKDYRSAAEDIRKFLVDFPQDPQAENHWTAFARMFDEEPDIPAIGFWHTSVSENPFNGPWNDESEDYDPPEWDEMFSIYDSLKELKREQIR